MPWDCNRYRPRAGSRLLVQDWLPVELQPDSSPKLSDVPHYITDPPREGSYYADSEGHIVNPVASGESRSEAVVLKRFYPYSIDTVFQVFVFGSQPLSAPRYDYFLCTTSMRRVLLIIGIAARNGARVTVKAGK